MSTPPQPLPLGSKVVQATNRNPADGGPAVLLQRIGAHCPPDRRSLYWRADPLETTQAWADAESSPAGIELGPKTRLGFDTYFNSFYEAQWHQLTGMRSVLLQVEVRGAGLLRVYREAFGHRILVHEQRITSGITTVRVAIETVNFRQQGLLFAELATSGERLTFLSGRWLSDMPIAAGVGMALVICTFNREADLARVLAAIDADRDLVDRLARIIVVNQGRPGLTRHLDAAGLSATSTAKLHILEQSNFGGAGGFTRGLLTALDDDAVSHVVLLDDDIDVEPDSLFRLISLHALAKQDAVVGGHMLDLLQPTRLYEAGAIISDRHWAFLPQHHTVNLADPASLGPLSRPHPVHYNGWWCCSFPLTLVRQHGLPLPCFIRGDDVEFGLRLHSRGVLTISMPGVAVWHEPFYLKLGSWHLYYEVRNMLITAALHMPEDRWPTVRRIGRLTAMHLLTFRYFSTALILAGIRDYLAGPTVLDGDPLLRHQALLQLKTNYPSKAASRGIVLQKQGLKRRPANDVACFALLAYLLVRNALVHDRAAPPHWLEAKHFDWLNMRGVESVALETWWDQELPVFQRSRPMHRLLLRDAANLLLQLYRRGPSAGAAWRAAFSRLTANASWQAYLGLPPKPPPAPAVKQEAA